jgi:hypothetical protein
VQGLGSIRAAILLLALPSLVSCSLPAEHRSRSPPAEHPQPVAARKPAEAIRLADFRNERPTPEARQMANWVLTSGDQRNMSFVIVDKKAARVYVFDADGRLKARAPALLGAAIGDDTVPGVGDKPLARVLPYEKTTPAGRFVAEVGMSTRGEDVVWVDYGAAISMHRVLRVRRRLASLASPTIADNRMTFGCINLPRRFYEKVLRPTVDAGGAVIYILPETRKLGDTFPAFYVVGDDRQLAQH